MIVTIDQSFIGEIHKNIKNILNFLNVQILFHFINIIYHAELNFFFLMTLRIEAQFITKKQLIITNII